MIEFRREKIGMTPYFEQERIEIYLGDSLDVLRSLPSESVHCVVTSPPYYGLRDYGTGEWDGGDTNCDHKPSETLLLSRSVLSSTLGGGKDTQKNSLRISDGTKNVCPKCGAIRIDDQIGLENTPQEYIARMVEVFREVRRVLRSDGTCYVNMGDSYAGSGRGGNHESGTKQGTNKGSQSVGVLYGRDHESAQAERARIKSQFAAQKDAGIKPKDLMGMPWRLAFALQADGWWLRQDIIWSKPNPMPESVTDRCTKAHEYVFLLSKSAKYYYDAQAISEPSQGDYGEGKSGKWIDSAQDIGSVYGIEKVTGNQNKGRLNQFSGATRNKRSVWTIASESFSEAHFATYPTKLVEPCIFAGTSEKGCCPKCGAPWSREVDRVPATSKECPKTVSAHIARGGTGTPVGTVGKSGSGRINGSITTIGWYPSCSCNKDDGGLELEPIPCTVLDPFSGSGTTGLVARDNGCKYIGIELNPEYIDISAKRMAQQVLSFA